MRVTLRKKVHVPWLQLGREPELYLDLETLPEGFNVIDPSKLTKHALGQLWDHWSERARARQPILRFTLARTQDVALPGSRFVRQPKRNRILESTDDESDPDGQAKADKDRLVGPSVGLPQSKRSRLWHDSDDQATDDEPERPPPSKRPRLSKHTAAPDEQSPAANNNSRTEFLRSLSKETLFVALLDGVLALPAVVSPILSVPVKIYLTALYMCCKASAESSLSAPKSKLSLPVWASWDWGEKYLPMNIHAGWQEFGKELELLDRYMFADHEAGSLIVLALGLLLRECWRAVELEEDDENAPEFLHGSHLDKTRAMERVLKGIKGAISRLPSPDADKEKQKEKELESSAKGRKVRMSEKKRGKLPARTHTPPPVASGSRRPSGTQEEAVSPAQNVRSQRQRKPSKKLRDSD